MLSGSNLLASANLVSWWRDSGSWGKGEWCQCQLHPLFLATAGWMTPTFGRRCFAAVRCQSMRRVNRGGCLSSNRKMLLATWTVVIFVFVVVCVIIFSRLHHGEVDIKGRMRPARHPPRARGSQSCQGEGTGGRPLRTFNLIFMLCCVCCLVVSPFNKFGSDFWCWFCAHLWNVTGTRNIRLLILTFNQHRHWYWPSNTLWYLCHTHSAFKMLLKCILVKIFSMDSHVASVLNIFLFFSTFSINNLSFNLYPYGLIYEPILFASFVRG